MMGYEKVLSGIALATVLLCINGCKSAEDYNKERVSYAVKHFERAQYSNVKLSEILSLNECVVLAVKNNLDLEVLRSQELVAKEMTTAEMLGMLPELNISDSLTARSNTLALSSEQVDGSSGAGNYTYSQSQDKNLNYLNVDLALSVLDFGLAFFNTQQANDRQLLRQQQTERAKQNLILDTVRLYFQVAATQRAVAATTKLLEECKSRYKLIDEMGDSGQISPFRAFDEIQRFINMEKRLTNLIRNYENSCVELRSLLGLYPEDNIRVDDSVLDTVPDFTLPEMELMEQISLMKRPELYQIDLQKHINVIECRKSILLMFPNVRVFVDFSNSTNSYLYSSSWWELGVRAAYNLLKLPQHIATYNAYSKQVDTEEYRTYAQAIAIMAQVRIAESNLESMKERYEIDNRVHTAYKKNLDRAVASGKISSSLSQLELDHMKLMTTETEVEKLISLGNYYVAYFRVLNTLGVADLQAQNVEAMQKTLAEARVEAQAEIDEAKAQYLATEKSGD